MNQLFDAFISYGRADSKEFAIKLNQRLIDHGFNVWFDQDDIPLAVDFQEQINSGIEKAHNFIFIIAPHSINSQYCLKEINLAIQYNKRIIPILHCEEISQATWQSRNPDQTIKQWQEYQAQGLNSSFANMHPAISKINWIYSRENIDDFAISFDGLVATINHHQDYVINHTRFLIQALDWQRNQQQNNYLLIGEDRIAAKSWLNQRFSEEQAPCIPTDLHCEFISESIKNANNLMTQVFLSASQKDYLIKKRIAKTLMREGFTIWTNQTDIKIGTDFKLKINQGIEGADFFVYLISPDTLRSPYCQEEYDYALANNKYIIPLLIETVDLELIPATLKNLQFIDLTQVESVENYGRGIDKLLKELKDDAYYFETHKLLLVKALKWHRQNRNTSILLRSYNLQHFVDWFKMAQQRQNYLPLPLQEEFINESLKQPKADSLEVFISYSRADSDFARQLNDALTEVGKLTWFDQESIASGEDFQQEIYRGIENCDNFLFIISPKSINSPYCADEVEYAHQLNKRFITVVYRPVNPQDLHPVLAKIQWIDFNQYEANFQANFPKLVRAIDTDREHVQSHSKWSQRAREWFKTDKNNDLLLRGSEFVLAQNWLETTLQSNKQPTATSLQQEFIATSETKIEAEAKSEKYRHAKILRLQKARTKEAEARLANEKKHAKRQKFFAGVATIGFMITSALGLTALFEYRKSKINEVKAMSLSSEALFASNKKLDALLEATRAKQKLQKLALIADKDSHSKVKQALQKVVYTIKEYNRLSGHYGAVLGVAYSPDQQLIASGSADNTIILWKEDGTLLKTLKGHQGSVNGVAFSPNSQLLASASVDNTIKLWDRDGTLIKTFPGEDDFSRVAFSPDGSIIAIASHDQTVQLWYWDGKQATLKATLRGDNQDGSSFNSVAFSPDNQLIAAGSDDHTIKVWHRDGTLLTTLGGAEGHTKGVRGVAFSPDSQLIASGSEDSTVKIWRRDGALLKTLWGHQASVRDVAFSPDGQLIVSGSYDHTLKLWQVDGALRLTLKGHRDQVTAVDFSPDGQFIISGSKDNSVRLWKPENNLLKTLFGHRNLVKAVDFSPNGKFIASGSQDRTVKLWAKDGTLLRTFTGHRDRINAVAFSPNSELIASGSNDRTVKLCHRDDKLCKTFTGHRARINAVAFSPNGELIASGSADQTIKLWDVNGKLRKTFTGHREEVNGVVFSPNGELIISGSGDNTIKIWHRDGRLLKTLTGHKSTVFAVDISPDGQFIVSGSGDNTVRLWHINGELLSTLKGHKDSVLGVKFRPNSTQIASASVDKTIKLWGWDGQQANFEQTLMGHDAAVQSIDFNPDGEDGHILASGSNDRTVILWTDHSMLSPDDLLLHGCNWIGNYLNYNQLVSQSDRRLCDNINLDHGNHLPSEDR